MWSSPNEGAKFWLNVLTEIQNRGLRDIFFSCVDGLSGFPEALDNLYAQTRVQLCIVHMLRSSLKFLGWKERQEVAAEQKSTPHPLPRPPHIHWSDFVKSMTVVFPPSEKAVRLIGRTWSHSLIVRRRSIPPMPSSRSTAHLAILAAIGTIFLPAKMYTNSSF